MHAVHSGLQVKHRILTHVGALLGIDPLPFQPLEVGLDFHSILMKDKGDTEMATPGTENKALRAKDETEDTDTAVLRTEKNTQGQTAPHECNTGALADMIAKLNAATAHGQAALQAVLPATAARSRSRFRAGKGEGRADTGKDTGNQDTGNQGTGSRGTGASLPAAEDRGEEEEEKQEAGAQSGSGSGSASESTESTEKSPP